MSRAPSPAPSTTRRAPSKSPTRARSFSTKWAPSGRRRRSKLLRVIQEKEFTPLGSNEVVKVDVRILAATNADLRKMVEEKQVPRGSLLPAQRHQYQSAAAARPARRYSAADPALPREIQPREREVSRRREQVGAALRARSHAVAAGSRLARQRARTGKCGRARGGAGFRRR